MEHVACMELKTTAYGFLIGKPELKRPLLRPGYRWEDCIKLDLKEMGWDGFNWIHMCRIETSGWLL